MEFDVVELPALDPPAEGEQAPEFERPLVTAEYWEDVALSELTAEGPVLLLFHPMDGAFPATYTWNEIRDRGLEGRPTGDGALQVVGVSISSPYEHKTLIRERGIDSRLFSDPGAGVAELYGVDWELDGMAGVREPVPAAFLIDGERVVRYAWTADEWPDFPPYDELEAAVEEL